MRSSVYGLSPEAKDTAARASRRAVNRPITRPASGVGIGIDQVRRPSAAANAAKNSLCDSAGGPSLVTLRSEEHTSELQSLAYLVCRLLLEKKKKNNNE